jgi:hypothetical protein
MTIWTLPILNTGLLSGPFTPKALSPVPPTLLIWSGVHAAVVAGFVFQVLDRCVVVVEGAAVVALAYIVVPTRNCPQLLFVPADGSSSVQLTTTELTVLSGGQAGAE